MPFSFRDPFPVSLGRNPTARYDKLYNVIKANIGDGLNTDAGTHTDAELVATTRMFCNVDRANERRVRQGQDPRLLTDPLLARWEAILGINAASTETEATRRARVASRILADYSSSSGSIARIVEESFAPWPAVVHYGSIATSVMSWPGGSPSAPNDWYSTVAEIAIEFIRPTSTTDAEADSKIAICRAALDEYTPAWVTFTFHETLSGDEFHWILGVSKLGVLVFGD